MIMTQLPTHRPEPMPVRSALFYHALNQAVAVAVATLNIHLAPDEHDAVTASDAEALRSLLESRLEPYFLLAGAGQPVPGACACSQRAQRNVPEKQGFEHAADDQSL